MNRLATRRFVTSGLAAICLFGACSSSSSESEATDDAPESADPAAGTSADTSAAPSDTSVSSADVSTTETPATAPAAGAAASGDFCADLKTYQLESQERTVPVIQGQADEGEYVAWVTDTLETLRGEGPSEATDFLELQKGVIPKVLEAARNNGEGIGALLDDPAYQAAYASFADWIKANCGQDVVDILLQGTG